MKKRSFAREKKSVTYKYILFDLDDTLYPRAAGLLNAIGERIIQYMTHKVGIPADDVPFKKREYYQQYGTSLQGLMREYDVDPVEYLHYVHDVNPADYFGISPPLDNMLYEIPLRKVIFTNADTAHTHRVLKTLGVGHHFDSIFDVQVRNYLSKPDPKAYHHVLETLNVNGENCIMVEDRASNLLPAKDLGMTTILVDSDRKSLGIDYAVPTVFHVGKILQELLHNSYLP